MNPGSILLGIGLLVWIVIYVGRPLLFPASLTDSKTDTASGADKNAGLKARKKSALYKLSDLDFDFKAKKITEEDYAPLRANLVAEVAQLMEQSDHEDNRIERLISARRKSQGIAPAAPRDAAVRAESFCTQCGKPLPMNANFCGVCGNPVAESFCGTCGGKLRPEDKFCPSCGK